MLAPHDMAPEDLIMEFMNIGFLSIDIAARLSEISLLQPDPSDDTNYFVVFHPCLTAAAYGTGAVASRAALAQLIFGECEQVPVID